MARKTKAEREEEAAVYRKSIEDSAREAYPKLIMDTLERATRLSFELKVREGEFTVIDRNDYNNFWTLTYEYTPASDDNLGMLMLEVERQEKADSEANIKWLKKQSALARLSKEDRELLGLE